MKSYSFWETEQRKADCKLFVDHPDGLREIMRTRTLVQKLNQTPPYRTGTKLKLLRQICGHFGESWLEPPVTIGIGRYLSIGDHVYINTNCIFEDNYQITLEDNVMFGPGVTVITSGHPVHPELRADGVSFCAPVLIKKGAWIGANATILPGVTIGENAVIGAGSVVSRDIPANVVAVGVPCRVLREINDHDKEVYFRGLTTEYGYSD